MKEDFNICSVQIGSITQAMRAQRALATAAIPTTVIKNDTSRGCIYALSFSCSQENNVKTVLERERIRVKSWKTKN